MYNCKRWKWELRGSLCLFIPLSLQTAVAKYIFFQILSLKFIPLQHFYPLVVNNPKITLALNITTVIETFLYPRNLGTFRIMNYPVWGKTDAELTKELIIKLYKNYQGGLNFFKNAITIKAAKINRRFNH